MHTVARVQPLACDYRLQDMFLIRLGVRLAQAWAPPLQENARRNTTSRDEPQPPTGAAAAASQQTAEEASKGRGGGIGVRTQDSGNGSGGGRQEQPLPPPLGPASPWPVRASCPQLHCRFCRTAVAPVPCWRQGQLLFAPAHSTITNCPHRRPLHGLLHSEGGDVQSNWVVPCRCRRQPAPGRASHRSSRRCRSCGRSPSCGCRQR